MPSDAFVGQVFMFAGNFNMRQTQMCNGQLLPVNQNAALFSLLGTTYGGNGTTTFALPNLQGRSPMHKNGADHPMGEANGSTSVTLLQSQMPLHNHDISLAMSTGGTPTTASSVNSYPATVAGTNLYSNTPGIGFMAPVESSVGTITTQAGGNLPHNNMQPYQVVTFVIALQGIFPPRS